MILLDTHVLLWLMAGSAQLGARARQAIQAALVERSVAVSSFTFWEIALLPRDWTDRTGTVAARSLSESGRGRVENCPR